MRRQKKPSPLNDLHVRVLATAAERKSRCLLPLPAGVTADEIATIIETLITQGLGAERATTGKSNHWRASEDGRGVTLVITDAGITALADRAMSRAPTESTGRGPTKHAVILDLLRRDGGASLSDMMETTGWQAHSLRGFLSGTVRKRLGLAVVSEKSADGERRYHVAA